MDERTIRILEYEKIIEMLAGHTVSSLGTERVKSLRPSKEFDTVSRWLDETTEAESVLASDGRAHLDSFPDIRAALKRAQIGGMLSIKEILQVGFVLKAAHRIKEHLGTQKYMESLVIIPNYIQQIRPHFQLMSKIFECIETEDYVSDHASSELLNIRRNIQRTNEKVRERLNSIIHSSQFQKYLQEPIVTIRNERYVVPIKQEHRGNVPGLIHDQSSSGATLFIEPMSVVEANNELREWQLKEEKEIERILSELTEEIDRVNDEIGATLCVLVDLDFMFAKGKFSMSMKGISPRLTKEQKVKIINGRHPLIKPDEVVPISIWMGEEFSTLVITGPNTGGKTVTLKTVGLFVLMNQSGLHLPADYGTEMGVFDDVFADIGDEQSIEQSLSTFSSHMTNIVKIINHVDDRSLVLFDELGAGTDPTEGAALAMSILTYLHERKTCTLATTHYSELKIFALTQDGMENAAMEFSVETLRPTYRLMIGVPGKSNAFEISRRLGLSEELIDGAKEFLSQEDIRFEDIISNMEQNRIAAQHEHEEARKQREELEKLKAAIKEKQANLNEQQNSIMRKAREEARKIVREAKEEAETVIKDLQKMAEELEEKERNKAIEEARLKLKTKADKLDDELSSYRKPSGGLVKPPKNLKLGETVYITNLDQKGQVLSLPDQNDDIQVQVGIMKVNVHLSNIRRAADDKKEQVSTRKKIGLRSKPISSELDIRGRNVEEALIEIDKYLDDVFLAGLNEITIIHGKGTGVLRNGVHEHIRRHPHVKSFRLGKFGEGESGVTVVELR